MTSTPKLTLEEEIRSVFPPMEMPSHSTLLLSPDDHLRHPDVLNDLEDIRIAGVDGEAIRAIHQEMALLSAKTWKWLLPYYLIYCLTDEAQYNRFETEFLIYNLGPELQFQRDTRRRLALLSKDQIRCLIHFLEWCRADKYWQGAFTNHIEKAISFLRVIESETL